MDLLREDRVEVQLDRKHKGLARAIARFHGTKYSGAEREFYREHRVLEGPGDSTGGLQGQVIATGS